MSLRSEDRNPISERNPKAEGRRAVDAVFHNFGFRVSAFGFWMVVACLLGAVAARAAEEFGDVSVSADAIFTGNTYHGYGEMRVVLENRSPTKAHVVTLVYPDKEYNAYGNTISRLSRTVSVGPDAREVVSLLQPPLPAQGNGSIRVEVDGRKEGMVRAPNANNHCNYAGRGGNMLATVFVSRSLDFDAVTRLFQAQGNTGSFTAAKAVGAPDATGAGYQPNCWMPNNGRRGVTNWLELEFSTPQPVSHIAIYQTQSPVVDGTITLQGTAGTNLASIAMSTGRSTAASAGWVQEFDLPAPQLAVKTVRLTYGSRVQPFAISVDAVQISGAGGSQWAADARASSDNSAAGMRMRPGGSTPDEVQCLRAESSVAEWSENWLAYSPFEAVVLNQEDLASATPAVRAALDDYSQAGGNVLLLGTSEMPAPWHAAETRKLPHGAEFTAGFGRVFAFDTENPGTLPATAVQRLRDSVREALRNVESLPNQNGAANAALPVVENLKIPARGTIIIMMFFVILIGPVNLIYLRRIKRRTWMLWTIPAISVATTLLVFVYSLLREGITPDARLVGLTVLDQTSHRAATIGGEAFYCPLTPGGGLHFDFTTEATPLVALGYGSGVAREVDWTQAQHFQRGWVSARVPAHFYVRKPETRRERIQVVNEGGRLQVVNSLGASIKTLWLADANMNLFQAAHVGAGEKGGLIPWKAPQSLDKVGVDGLRRQVGWAVSTDGLAENAGRCLRANTYVAVLEGNPFLENALGSAAKARRTKSTCVVYGLLEAPETAAVTR
jgi:hypothetical protein